MQVAVAVGTPTVSIFGPVSEIAYGPYPPGEKHLVVARDLECRPCYRNFSLRECREGRCLGDVTLDEVLNRIAKARDYVLDH